MTIAKIIGYASNIKRGHSLSLAQVKSDSGIFKAQQKGPYLYDFDIKVIPVRYNSEEYYDIDGGLAAVEYGAKTLTTQMPSKLVSNRGAWAGTPLIKGASQSGTSINLDGFTINVTGIVKANDWVQFAGSTKVYQVTSDASSDANGDVTITLNTPLIGTIADNAVVTHGNSVEFKLALRNPDSVDPKISADLICRFGLMKWEEVL